MKKLEIKEISKANIDKNYFLVENYKINSCSDLFLKNLGKFNYENSFYFNF